MTGILDWTHSIREIGDAGLARERVATAAERQALAAALGVREVAALDARYKIRPRAGGRFALSGDLAASVVQECVATLAPVTARIEEKFDVEFWPRDAMPPQPSGDVELLSGRDVEPIEGTVIDAGRIVYETFAAALDPYPRAPGVELEWFDPAENGQSNGPFAKLAEFKAKE